MSPEIQQVRELFHRDQKKVKGQFPNNSHEYGCGSDMKGWGPLAEAGIITRQSSFPNTDIPRPVSSRFARAEFYNKMVGLRQELREEQDQSKIAELKTKQEMMAKKLKERDKLDLDLLNNRKKIMVNMGKLGTQECEYVDLSTEDCDLTKPPIILVLGIGNGFNETGEFPTKVALSGRRVFMVTWPEAVHGKVTREYAKSLKKSKNYETTVALFELAIKQVLEENNVTGSVDFIGISLGSIIVSQLANKGIFDGKTGKVNLIAPPGVTEFKFRKSEIKKRVKMQFRSVLDNKDLLPRMVVANHEIVERSFRDRMSSVIAKKNLALNLIHKNEWWKNENLTEVNVIIFENDGATLNYEGIDEISREGVTVTTFPGGHETFGIKADDIIPRLVLS